MASASRNAARSGRRGKERRPWLAALQASRARDRARGREARGGKRGGTPRRDEPRDAPWWPSSGARGLSTDGGACGCGCARRSAANAANRTSAIKSGEPQLLLQPHLDRDRPQIAPNPQNAAWLFFSSASEAETGEKVERAHCSSRKKTHHTLDSSKSFVFSPLLSRALRDQSRWYPSGTSSSHPRLSSIFPLCNPVSSS